MKYLVAGILILIPAVLVFAILRLPVYLKNHLSEWVAVKSGNLYKLSFNDINLKAKGLSFSITGVELVPDTEIARQVNEINPGKVFYSFNSPEIQVNHFSLIQFLRERKFNCSLLKVVQPRLDLSGKNLLKSDSTASFRYLFRELQPLLGKKIREIGIGEIILEDARYELNRFLGDSSRISKAEKISLAIQKFRTDSLLAENPKMPFESDDIEIRIHNFQTTMGDSLHITKIGELIYSFKKSEVSASDFHLFPGKPDRSVTCYDVSVPKFHLKSRSIVNFSVNDSLMVDSLEFTNPVIRYTRKLNPKQLKIEDINNFDLYSLIRNQFKLIRIGNFSLTGASLEIFRQPDTLKYQQRFDKIGIHLTDFNLDSLSDLNPDKVL